MNGEFGVGLRWHYSGWMDVCKYVRIIQNLRRVLSVHDVVDGGFDVYVRIGTGLLRPLPREIDLYVHGGRGRGIVSTPRKRASWAYAWYVRTQLPTML